MKTRHHEKYREWEAQEVYIEGLTFCNLDEMETQGRKLKKKKSLMFDFYPTCLEKNQTRWYIYTWVLFSTHVWILTQRYGKRPTCVQKATQLYVCKCLSFSTHVWEKPLTCLFPPELWVPPRNCRWQCKFLPAA